MANDAGWVKVASLEDMREGEGFETGVEVAGEQVGLFLIEGKYYAVGECTHERGPVCQGLREGLEVTCSWHSARFNIATGQCIRGPVACRVDGSIEVGELEEISRCPPLKCFDVKVEGADIFVRSRA